MSAVSPAHTAYARPLAPIEYPKPQSSSQFLGLVGRGRRPLWMSQRRFGVAPTRPELKVQPMFPDGVRNDMTTLAGADPANVRASARTITKRIGRIVGPR